MCSALTWFCRLCYCRRSLAESDSPSSGKGLWGACDVLGAWWGSLLCLPWSLLDKGSTNLTRSHKAKLLTLKQVKMVLTAKAVWAIAHLLL